jgi:hypothetical protein
VARQARDAIGFGWLLASFALFCCAQPKPRAEALSAAPATSSSATVTTKAPQAMPRPTCTNTSPATPPHLESVLNIKPHDVYWVQVRAIGQEWTLAEPVAFPRHHAVRLEFTNQSDFPAFPEQPEQTLRVSFEVTAQNIQQVPGQLQWRNTVSARLIDVCPLAE